MSESVQNSSPDSESFKGVSEDAQMLIETAARKTDELSLRLDQSRASLNELVKSLASRYNLTEGEWAYVPARGGFVRQK